MSEFNQSKYANDYNKKTYDRLNIFVPKGKKAIIEEHRNKKGYKSINQYVNDLIDADLRADAEPKTKKRDLPDPGIRVAKL